MAPESPLDAGGPFVSPAQAITCGSLLFYAVFRRNGGGMSACVRGGRALVRRAGTRAEEIPNRMGGPYFSGDVFDPMENSNAHNKF